jgi:ATP-dependent Clp protease ATP-binding subunit ClpA
MNFEPDAQAAVDLAKRAVARGASLDLPTLLAALYHGTALRQRFPELAPALDEPAARRAQTPSEVAVDDALQPLLDELADSGEVVTVDELAAALLESDAGRTWLGAHGVPEATLTTVLRGLTGIGPAAEDASVPGWRGSRERDGAIEALSSYGRMLTVGEPPHRGGVEFERPMASLVRTLCKMRRRNALVLGQPGTGKSALVYELARRLVRGDASIPARIRDLDVFELSPVFLRSGAGMVGQYDERVKALIRTLSAYPKIVLFVDEIHSFLQSSVHERGPYSDANESFKAALGHGDFACIGCTTTAEYRFFIERDQALARRFGIIRLEPPTPEAAVRILQARRPAMAKYYDPLRIPDAIVARTVELTEQYLPSRFQPDKSIQLLDEACAYCVTAEPPLGEVTEDALWNGLEDIIGHSLARSATISEEDLFGQLRAKIVGQDETLRGIARAFVAGLGGWGKGTHPRGVFFFAGPTGVGKTETALLLSTVLGGGRESLVRIDCNMLQGGHDAGPALHILLGPPPGYLGYVRGQGGVLSKVRDNPECVVLFDEIEKAPPGVGKLLLQLLDSGSVEDNDGNRLDFRRAFIVFTTNAGCTYDLRASIGFAGAGEPGLASPSVDIELLKAELRQLGLGEEFLGRISHWFSFQGLAPASIQQVLQLQLEGLRRTAEQRGFVLAWDPAIVGYLASRWQPRYGVRHLTTILRNRIEEQLSVAEAQGDLKGVATIRLAILATTDAEAARGLVGLATRERRGDTMLVQLA